MRVITVLFGPCALDELTAYMSAFSHDFKRFNRFAKLATSSMVDSVGYPLKKPSLLRCIFPTSLPKTAWVTP